MALTTVAEYKVYAKIGDTSQDTELAVYLSMAETMARRYCGRNLTNGFESTARTETYDGNNEESIQLWEWPVTAIGSVSRVSDAGTLTAYASTAYRVNGDTGVLSRLGAVLSRFGSTIDEGFDQAGVDRFGIAPNWPAGIQNISVTYTAGYSSIPADLEGAVWMLMDLIRGNAGGNSQLQSESLGSYSYTRFAADQSSLAKQIKSILGIYRTTAC